MTENLRDFPASALGRWNIQAQSADDFVLDRIAGHRRAPPTGFADVLDALERTGLSKSIAELRS